MLYRIIDKITGFFKRDDFTCDEETEQGIETPCPEGFSWPKWDGEAWVEGGGTFEQEDLPAEVREMVNATS